MTQQPDTDNVRTETRGSVLVVTIDRPEARNAVDRPTADLLAETFRAFDADDSLAIAVLTGANGTFCAGADLKGIGDGRGNRVDADMSIDGPMGPSRMQLDKPVIAAVEGYAFAGGTEVLQGTDIRVASTSARFAVSEAKRSLYPMGGSAVRLRRQIPYAWAVDILVSGRDITAEEALQLGLVSYVVPEGDALTKAKEVAANVAACGPLAVEAIMQVLRETEHMSEQEAFAYEQPLGNAVFASDDAKEGPLAFKEKRDPVYNRK
jgi:enoyl-CoA hydratase